MAYYFVCPKGIEAQAHILSFRDWLLSEALKAEPPTLKHELLLMLQ
jgi:LysR family glycine cleavage system transcriptional activator